MAVNPPNQPDNAAALKSGTGSRKAAGTPSHAADSTLMAGQYPPDPSWGNALFGGSLDGSGAPGSAGATYSSATDATNEPGQTQDTFTGIPDGQIGGTGASGAPGSSTNPNTAGGTGTPITYTNAGSYLGGSYQSVTYSDHTDGPQDSTQANDEGYATGGPQLPAIKGNEPTPGSGRWQTGGGRVMRGGRDVRG